MCLKTQIVSSMLANESIAPPALEILCKADLTIQFYSSLSFDSLPIDSLGSEKGTFRCISMFKVFIIPTNRGLVSTVLEISLHIFV